MVVLAWACATTSPATVTTGRLRRLQIFYGWPSGFDGATSPAAAAAKLARYDAVVLGGGLERAGHADHQGARQIVASLAGRTVVFGYIPLGHATGLTLPQIEQRLTAWKSLGVRGVFFDEAGYDYGNTRERQNAAFAAAHARGLAVFANAHDPDDLASGVARAPFNATGAKTTLRAGDHYLYESFGLRLGRAEDEGERQRKLAKLPALRRAGVAIWGVTTVAAPGPVDRGAWERVRRLAREAGLFGLGYGAHEYGAKLQRVPQP